MPSTPINSLEQIKTLGNGLVILNFWAEWTPVCLELNKIFETLSDQYKDVRFALIEAEKVESVTEHYKVEAVPTFVFLREQKEIDRVEGANAADLANKLSKYSPDPAKESIRARCERLVNAAPVMLFMKGTAHAPQCGFSRKMVDLLQENGVQFDTFNILSDEEIRNGLKEYSNWPTYPQLFVEGKLVGGLDVTKALLEEGEFWNQVPTKYQTTKKQKVTTTPAGAETKEQLNQRLKSLIESAPLMLFMKGTADAPKCGFSSKVVDRLKKNNLNFKTFDILNDESVRSGLKEYSNWPTFPQLYHKGKLIGGCDIVCEMDDNGELASLTN